MIVTNAAAKHRGTFDGRRIRGPMVPKRRPRSGLVERRKLRFAEKTTPSARPLDALRVRRPEIAVEERRAAGFAVGHEGEAGDVADLRPAEALVKACAVAVGDGVEDEEGLAGVAGGGLGRAHEGGAEAAAAGAAVDEHLAEVGAVGLVFREVEDQLDGAADAFRILGDEEGALAAADAVCD